MNITVKTGNLADLDNEILLVGHFEDNQILEGAARLLDEKCNGLISELIEQRDFEGKLFSSSVVYTRGLLRSRRIMIAGLGKMNEFNLEKLRGVFLRRARR